MKKIFAILVALVAALPMRAADTPLFNGKDLAGWKTYVKDNAAPGDKTWSVRDGNIVCLGKPNGYIITEKEYENYVLKLEWRFPKDSKGGNSGVLMHCQGPDQCWPKAVEAQLQSGRAGDIWTIDTKLEVGDARRDPNQARHFARIGDVFEKNGVADKKGRQPYKIVGKDVEKPFGEWNQYEIVCDGNTIKLTVNGHLVNAGKNCESTKGKILLQSEGSEIHFRSITIRTK